MSSTQVVTGTPKTETDLREIAQDIVRRAMAGGATAAECVVREGDEFSTLVRLGQVETLKESGSKSIGVRVFFGQRAASTYSSDFSSRRPRPHGEVCAGTGEDHVGRSFRRHSVGRAARPDLRRSRPLSRRRLFAAWAPTASTTLVVRKKLHSILIRASRTAKVDRSTRPLDTRCSRIRTVSLASTSARTAQSQPCRSPRLQRVPCSATTGIPLRGR